MLLKIRSLPRLLARILGAGGALYKNQGALTEFAVPFGFPACGSGTRPCLACTWHAGLGFIEPLVDVNALSFPCSINSHEDYEAACLRCERPVVLPREDRDNLLPLLSYDKRTTSASSNGRRLLLDYPRHELYRTFYEQIR